MSREQFEKQKQVREQAERKRLLHEQWKRERLHELASIFEQAFNERSK